MINVFHLIGGERLDCADVFRRERIETLLRRDDIRQSLALKPGERPHLLGSLVIFAEKEIESRKKKLDKKKRKTA